VCSRIEYPRHFDQPFVLIEVGSDASSVQVPAAGRTLER
jgi:hypothetical protein